MTKSAASYVTRVINYYVIKLTVLLKFVTNCMIITIYSTIAFHVSSFYATINNTITQTLFTVISI